MGQYPKPLPGNVLLHFPTIELFRAESIASRKNQLNQVRALDGLDVLIDCRSPELVRLAYV